MTKHKKLWE